MREITATMTCNKCGHEEIIFCPQGLTTWPYTHPQGIFFNTWKNIGKDKDLCRSCVKKLDLATTSPKKEGCKLDAAIESFKEAVRKGDINNIFSEATKATKAIKNTSQQAKANSQGGV